jgi:uncharacterized protein YfaS (alpha-2-macroglobulin family)
MGHRFCVMMLHWTSIRNKVTYMKKSRMGLRATCIALLGLFCFTAKAQTDTVFAKEWAVIDSLVLKQDLPKTALAKLNELSLKADQRKLSAQAVKALIYRYTLQDRITTDDPAQTIRSVRAEIIKTNEPTQKAVLYSLLANQYANYYSINRWQLYSRTDNSAPDKKDISTWSARDFDTAIINNFQRSLKDKKTLQQTAVADYDAVIIKGNMRYTRPTLFDLLAHTALDQFVQPDLFVPKPIAAAVFNDQKALLPLDEFLGTKFQTKDSTERSWHALQLFRELLSFHRNDADKNALVDADLRRIQWIYEQTSTSNKDSLYRFALQSLTERFPKTDATAGAWYLLALFESNNAGSYDAQGDTTYRFGYARAEQLILKAIPQFSSGDKHVLQLQRLLEQIRMKVLSTETETVNVPAKPILAVATYRNTDTLFGRIYRLSATDNFYTRSETEEVYWQKIKKLPVVRSFSQTLPATYDHQLHKAYLKLDALASGAYLLVTSTSAGFPDSANTIQVSSMQPFNVSRISYIKSQGDLFVLDRETGKPMAGVKVATLKSRYNATTQKTIFDTVAVRVTDQKGLVQSGIKNANIRYVFYAVNDTLATYSDEYIVEPQQPETKGSDYEKKNSRVFFFTDRSIYRPGQTVFFKGIAVTKDVDTHLSKIITSKDPDWVYLKDANNKTIDSLRYTLNDFGSFAGNFKLPPSGLTGYFSISTKSFNFSQYGFSVEEYKRPKFNVHFDKPKNNYRLNDTIIITGEAKAYAGNSLTNAKVVYNVTRTGRYPMPFVRRPIGTFSYREIAHGELKTDSNGKFTIRFKALADDITDSTGNPLFNFAVTADVTDINGETRSTSTQVNTGFGSILLGLNTPAITEKDSLRHIAISSTNLSGEKQPAIVHVKMQLLRAPDRLIRPRLVSKADQSTMSEAEFIRDFPNDEYKNESDPANWPVSNTLLEQDVDTKDTGLLKIPPGSLKAGYYKIEATTTDHYGKTITTYKTIQLIDRAMLSFPTYDLSYTVNNNVEPGQQAEFLSGTSAKNIFVITTITRQQQRTKIYDVVPRNEGVTTLKYAVDESDRGGLVVSEAFVINSRVYTHQYMINVPWTNKTMAVNFASYRNKTEPGNKETWTITINGPKVDSTAAELLTTMYDASLDQFRPNYWMTPALWGSTLYTSAFEGRGSFGVSQAMISNVIHGWHLEPDLIRYDQLAVSANELWKEQILQVLSGPAIPESLRKSLENKLYELGISGNRDARVYASTLAYYNEEKSANPRRLGNLAAAGLMEESFNKTAVSASAPPPDTRTADLAAPMTEITEPLQVRTNFSETAFFFPQLHADSVGNFSFSFTMPESLTQWKWMALAHTKELAFGYNNTNVVTQKKLMVQPNMPRFLREGDRVELSTKIVNMTDKEISGQATLELFDATTNTPVDGWFNNVLPAQFFTIEAGQSTSVQFPLQVPFSFNKPLNWRIVAKTGEISDGEENVLPVLTNRMLVTETLPVYLTKDTTQTFRFEKLLNNNSETLTHQGLTVEYTSNPVWYAVQALPYLIEYPYECAEQTFNRLYANMLASFIVHKSPRLQEVFGQWKKDSTALLSNLQKNQELKQLLLQETPWVFQATTEEQQKKNIALLFDLAKLSDQTERFIEELQKTQLPDGGFPWFKGGNPDRYITQYILTGIGKLKRLGAMTPDIALRLRNTMLQALRYADKKIVEEYTALVKSKADLSKQPVSHDQLDYLYMRSFFGDILPLSSKESDYYYQQAKKYWVSLNSYYKARLGLVAYRNKDANFVTSNILPAILENASTDTKLGMYWKNSPAYFWYQSPVEHQSMMIAFFSEVGNGNYSKELNDMRTWLLLNKQTNNWRTTIATADACYALLLNGSDWLNNEKQVVIRLGNYTAASNLQQTEAGTGYFKKRIDGKIVNEQMGDIYVSVRSNDPKNSSPSWGAVYWQYFEDMDKISSAGSPLSLSKQLFIEKNTDKGKLLVPVKDGDELKIGDRIISRIVLRSDRDMDYLHLKDMRAASMEPVNVLSGYKWQGGLGYYESTKDVASDFFISHLSKGVYVFEYPLFVTHTGVFSVGIATIQNMYAPEFSSHSEGIKIRVAK